MNYSDSYVNMLKASLEENQEELTLAIKYIKHLVDGVDNGFRMDELKEMRYYINSWIKRNTKN